METIYLSQPTTTTFSKGVAADNRLTLTTTQNQVAGNNHMLVSTASATRPRLFKTVIDVVGEGLKQNFLGPNIDMEFLTLTLRSFASTSARAIQQFVKPLTKKHEVENQNPCRQLNQPCF